MRVFFYADVASECSRRTRADMSRLDGVTAFMNVILLHGTSYRGFKSTRRLKELSCYLQGSSSIARKRSHAYVVMHDASTSAPIWVEPERRLRRRLVSARRLNVWGQVRPVSHSIAVQLA